MLYGAILFRFFGVLTKWIVLNIFFLIKKKGTISFKLLWHGKDIHDTDLLNSVSGEFGDILIGVAVVLLTVIIIIKLGL
ncbi:hypothetical protein SAMN06265379_101954 [Saccharicrinis carchari]|uniref:Uncharacterized protein n=1 Tax=Saccharicrinis carchari TaxID=1168039 RepID=A0A521BI02_SACCC|nr:hypothetical protein [Saccharicrinis carchari]SMO46768.1 hypothetical protein SAMN06265379_101954 [Saccharicrinis carchari]